MQRNGLHYRVTYEGEPDVISNAKVVDVDTKIVRKDNDNYCSMIEKILQKE